MLDFSKISSGTKHVLLCSLEDEVNNALRVYNKAIHDIIANVSNINDVLPDVVRRRDNLTDLLAQIANEKLDTK